MTTKRSNWIDYWPFAILVVVWFLSVYVTAGK
jgi:hypothetical protein